MLEVYKVENVGDFPVFHENEYVLKQIKTGDVKVVKEVTFNKMKKVWVGGEVKTIKNVLFYGYLIIALALIIVNLSIVFKVYFNTIF